jgi:C-methyltransferase C-terminal domain/Methyltransferase domain/Putative zinc binding domain
MIECRICKKRDLDLLYDFGMNPVAGYLVESMQTALACEKFSNQLVYCPSCGLIQQGVDSFKAVLIDKVYSNYRPTYSMSTHVRDYMNKFINEAMEFTDVKNEIVLEIGSNDGSMFDLLRLKGVLPAGIDPSAVISASGNDTIVVRDFFSRQVAKDFVDKYGRVKLLFSRHTLEHVFDPADFMEAIDLVLDDQGCAVIEVPYLPAQLNGNQYAAMTFQHISFFTLASLKQLGELCGLFILNAKPSRMDGGSIVVHFVKNSRAPVSDSCNVKGLLELEQSSGMTSVQGLQAKFKGVGDSITLARKHILGLLENSCRIVGYGAGAKGQALLNMLNLPHDVIPNVVDDTPGSKGMYIPGTGTKVVDSSDVCFSEADFVLITAPTHVDEIVAKEQVRHPRVSFIRTSPDFSYVSNL